MKRRRPLAVATSVAFLVVAGSLTGARPAAAEPVRVIFDSGYELAVIERVQGPVPLVDACAPSCASPWLDTRDTYRARLSRGVSPPFRVGTDIARVSLERDARLHDAALTVLSLGTLATLIGLAVINWGGDGVACGPDHTTGCVGDALTAGGLVILGVSVLMSLMPSPVSVTLHPRSVARLTLTF